MQLIEGLIGSENEFDKCRGTAAAMTMGWSASAVELELQKGAVKESRVFAARIDALGEALVGFLDSKTPALVMGAAWAMAWILSARLWEPSPELVRVALSRLFNLWAGDYAGVHYFAWAICGLPVLSDGSSPLNGEDAASAAFVLGQSQVSWRHVGCFRQVGALIAAYYLGEPWDRAELRQRARKVLRRRDVRDRAFLTRAVQRLVSAIPSK